MNKNRQTFESWDSSTASHSGQHLYDYYIRSLNYQTTTCRLVLNIICDFKKFEKVTIIYIHKVLRLLFLKELTNINGLN